MEQDATRAFLEQKKTSAMKQQPRKLVILPAKPAPRKSRSVMQNHPGVIQTEPTLENLKNFNARSRSKKAEVGVLDELKRLDQKNHTFTGDFSGKSTTSSVNTKALKNMSPELTNLIENRPMQSYAKQMAMEDTNRFMTMNLQKRKPIFKNYIHNNASILRKEVQTSKMQEFVEHERA